MSAVTSAGAYVPFTQTFVQGSVTTAIPLVGQILNNGKTNFVGYDSGSAAYIVPSSAAGASATTLANGNTYFISSGKAPTGYTLVPGGAATSTGSAAATTSSGQTSAVTTSVSTGTGTTSNAGTTAGGGSIATTTATRTTTSSPTTNAAVIAGPATGVEGMMLGFLTMVLGLLI